MVYSQGESDRSSNLSDCLVLDFRLAPVSRPLIQQDVTLLTASLGDIFETGCLPAAGLFRRGVFPSLNRNARFQSHTLSHSDGGDHLQFSYDAACDFLPTCTNRNAEQLAQQGTRYAVADALPAKQPTDYTIQPYT